MLCIFSHTKKKLKKKSEKRSNSIQRDRRNILEPSEESFRREESPMSKAAKASGKISTDN